MYEVVLSLIKDYGPVVSIILIVILIRDFKKFEKDHEKVHDKISTEINGIKDDINDVKISVARLEEQVNAKN